MIKIPGAIFREYDIRGIADRDLSADFALLLGRAYAQHLRIKMGSPSKNPKVSVGKDCRLTSDSYAAALVKGMQSGGIDVVRLGTCATPLTYFSIHHLNLDGGIMVTGSHNPGDYNGFKICIGKGSLHGAEIQELKGRMEKLNTEAAPNPTGSVSDFAVIPAYIHWVVENTPKLPRKKVVLDAGNGTASTIAPELFRRLGADVIPLYCELDGRFPNHHPDPTVPDNLRDLVATVLKEKADFGIGFDGDSDRIGVVDNQGRILFGDELMVLFARDVLRDHPGATIISEVKSSHRLYDDIAKHGGKPIMWKTGHSLIKSKMKETQAALAGEMSGHIFFADRYFGYDDAIYAGVRALEIACRASGPFSSLLADLPKAFATPEIRVDCLEEKKFALVEETKKRLSAGRKVNDIDGVRVDFGDGWGLVRASNTQPVLVLRFEATSQARLSEIRALVENHLREAAVSIGHPSISTTGAPH